METVQQNGRFTLFSSKIHSIYYLFSLIIPDNKLDPDNRDIRIDLDIKDIRLEILILKIRS